MFWRKDGCSDNLQVLNINMRLGKVSMMYNL